MKCIKKNCVFYNSDETYEECDVNLKLGISFVDEECRIKYSIIDTEGELRILKVWKEIIGNWEETEE